MNILVVDPVSSTGSKVIVSDVLRIEADAARERRGVDGIRVPKNDVARESHLDRRSPGVVRVAGNGCFQSDQRVERVGVVRRHRESDGLDFVVRLWSVRPCLFGIKSDRDERVEIVSGPKQLREQLYR
ncbi:hypothetical protein IGS67_08110 [Flavimobilis sp. GY10621]|uniref:Uncharacterized protein n=1 Tax=Flavimobilis rhizosphaerae TaxID=2775421 RepID=A0ABR9DQR2_9MICO|nr:hypothetical protein [Flavimobilis rhizosphaerae]MBD9699452.1 hypothetical protein [Flavimobilis rhizosphaerae]